MSDNPPWKVSASASEAAEIAFIEAQMWEHAKKQRNLAKKRHKILNRIKMRLRRGVTQKKLSA